MLSTTPRPAEPPPAPGPAVLLDDGPGHAGRASAADRDAAARDAAAREAAAREAAAREAVGRDAAWRDVETLTREFGRTAAAMDAAMAARLGLSGTDFACWTIVLSAQRPIAAGRLARLAALSSGAVTGVLDRLERRGLVRRMPDPHDRRKVLVAVDPHQRQRLAQVWEPLRQLLAAILSRRTEPERAVIAHYLEDVVHAAHPPPLP